MSTAQSAEFSAAAWQFRAINEIMKIEVPADLLRQHDRLLQKLDQWLRSIQAKYASHLQCGRGCAKCCYGLFDVSIPDAIEVAKGLAALPEKERESVIERAAAIQRRIEECADLNPPFLLDSLSQDRIDQLVEAVGEVSCPFLDAKDSCLNYVYRPLACRLEGLPMVDAQDGLFGDWCERNFLHGLTPEITDSLRLDYYAIQAIEQDAALFIPSVIYAISYGKWNITIR